VLHASFDLILLPLHRLSVVVQSFDDFFQFTLVLLNELVGFLLDLFHLLDQGRLDLLDFVLECFVCNLNFFIECNLLLFHLFHQLLH
jgi:hypothetical protein